MKDRSELESMTKDELVEHAEENDIEVSQHWVKDDIIKTIIKGQKAAAKTGKQQTGKPDDQDDDQDEEQFAVRKYPDRQAEHDRQLAAGEPKDHPNIEEELDPDERFDSHKHREILEAKLKAGTIERQQAVQIEDARLAENQEIANFQGLPRDGETREQLLDRIRAMRQEMPKEAEVAVFRSEAQQKEFDAEQEAGRTAVAKAQEALDKYQYGLRTQAAVAGEKNPLGGDDTSVSSEPKHG